MKPLNGACVRTSSNANALFVLRRNILGMKKKIWLYSFIFILVSVGIGAGIALNYYESAQRPTDLVAGETEVKVTIPKGAGQAEIARILEEKGIVRDAFAFRIFMKLEPDSIKSKAGDYQFQRGMNWSQIIKKLIDGDTYVETISFTIPEGFTVEQIEQRMISKNVMTMEQSRIAQKKISSKLLTATTSSEKNEIKSHLEGYLFPATYTFQKNSTPEHIYQTIHDELAQQLQQISSEWEQQLQKLSISVHELLTIASLVEREVVVNEERPIVAGVIYNRLKQKMPLQIDATVQYALPEHKERLLFKDLKFEDPYNTYLHAGLPPGPIANPGLASIRAALYPEYTEYLFYVTKDDGTSGHVFAKTYEEHLRNINRKK